ncbi:transglycosylase family protein [Candidatus Parcubacteria bacterium]|nr:transglycosylase family protein [Candidatus Parcubacteria bacterium]
MRSLKISLLVCITLSAAAIPIRLRDTEAALVKGDSEKRYMSYLEAPASPVSYAEYSQEFKPNVKTISLRSLNKPLAYILQKIADCESGNNPQAKNPHSSAKGLLQIIDGTWKSFQCEGSALNRDDNFQCGMKIATLSGLHHWNASRTCWNTSL